MSCPCVPWVINHKCVSGVPVTCRLPWSPLAEFHSNGSLLERQRGSPWGSEPSSKPEDIFRVGDRRRQAQDLDSHMPAEFWDRSHPVTELLYSLLLCSVKTPQFCCLQMSILSVLRIQGFAWIGLTWILPHLSARIQWSWHLPTCDFSAWPGLPYSLAAGFLESYVTSYDQAFKVTYCHFLPEPEIQPSWR